MCLDEKENHILAAEIAVWGYVWGVWIYGGCGGPILPFTQFLFDQPFLRIGLLVEIVVWAPHCWVWGICGDTCGVGGPGQNIHVLCMEEDSSCTNYRCVLQNAYDLLNQTQ